MNTLESGPDGAALTETGARHIGTTAKSWLVEEEAIVRHAQPKDQGWVLRVWRADQKWLGIDQGRVWYRYWQEVKRNPQCSQRWIVAVWPLPNGAEIPLGFAHYHIRKDGWFTLYEIGVDTEWRRRGVASLLVDQIGYPQRAKTDSDNEPSNAFYLSLGFRAAGVSHSRDGVRTLNIYEKWDPNGL